MPKKNQPKTKFNNVAIKTLKAKVQIEDIVAIDFPLRKAGNNYFLPCRSVKGINHYVFPRKSNLVIAFRVGNRLTFLDIIRKLKGCHSPKRLLRLKNFLIQEVI